MRKIVILIRVVVCQILTPYRMIRTRLINQLRSGCAKDYFQPMQVFIPVKIGYFVLIHIERTNRQRAIGIITRSRQKLVFFTDGKCTTLYRYHTDRINIAHSFVSLEISGRYIVVIPTRSVGYFGVQFTRVASTQHYNQNQEQILRYVIHHIGYELFLQFSACKVTKKKLY